MYLHRKEAYKEKLRRNTYAETYFTINDKTNKSRKVCIYIFDDQFEKSLHFLTAKISTSCILAIFYH